MNVMRMKLPLIRNLAVPPARAPILRYGVALLSAVLALIPTLLLTDVAESRLVVFAVAIMVSAWYGGWKPGLAATTFALTVSAYYSLTGEHTPTEYRKALAHLILFFAVALLICWFNAALRATQESLDRSESNFRSLVMNAPYGICRCNVLGIVLDANPALVAMFGYTSATELVGRHLGSLYADSQQWFRTADYFHAGKEFNDLTTECLRKDGTAIAARISGRAIPNGKNGSTFEVFMEDITETRTLEQQLRQAQKMEAIGRLAGGIAHDFNNLLTIITSYSELALDSVAPGSSAHGGLREILAAARRAAGLTRQLLGFSRTQPQALRVAELNPVAGEIVKSLHHLIGEDIELTFIPGQGLGRVRLDPVQIEQILMNLAANSRDAMPQGGQCTVETSNVLLDEQYAGRKNAVIPPGRYAVLTVTDTGAGIPADQLAHVFEPFYTTKSSGKGTGLGLATVYGIVKQNQGFIWVYSEPGMGTTFKIYLPCVPDQPSTVEVPDAAAETSARGTETVLLVEDEEALRRAVAEFLSLRGYTVLEARDGLDALSITKNHGSTIDLAVTDVVMPRMSGGELASELLRLRPETRVLFLSGYAGQTILDHKVGDVESNFLQKPFTLKQLAGKVRTVLDHSCSPA